MIVKYDYISYICRDQKTFIMKYFKIFSVAFLLLALSSISTLNAETKLCPMYYSRYYLHCNICGNDSCVPCCLFNTEVGTGGDCNTDQCPHCGNDGICIGSVS